MDGEVDGTLIGKLFVDIYFGVLSKLKNERKAFELSAQLLLFMMRSKPEKDSAAGYWL